MIQNSQFPTVASLTALGLLLAVYPGSPEVGNAACSVPVQEVGCSGSSSTEAKGWAVVNPCWMFLRQAQ